MEEFASLCALAERLRAEPHQRIGVDGIDGARKTTVASALAMELQLPLISLDNYLHRNQGGFVEFLQYDELAKNLREQRDFIVEGVCLLHVLKRVNTELDVLLYIQRYHRGVWADKRELTVPPEQVDGFLEREHDLLALLSGKSVDREPSLLDDLVRYHSQYQPHERARYVFRWDER